MDKILENKLIKQIKEHKYAVTCLDWLNHDEKDFLLTCSDDKTINIFNASLIILKFLFKSFFS